MLKQAEVPAISKAIDGLYVMNDNDRLKELARMREKAMHDRASELEEAMLKGRTDLLAELFVKMKASGMSDSQINAILNS